MKKTFKFTAIILTVCFLLQIISFGAYATGIENQVLNENTENTEQIEEAQETKPYIMFEDEEKRTETEKHFKMSDGSYKIAMYEEPVHYLDENNIWQNIDNTLIIDDENKADNEKEYTISANDSNIKINKQASENKVATIEKSGYEISWRYIDSQNSTSEIVDNRAPKTGDEAFTELENINKEIWYRNVYENVDLQYIIKSTGIKENIILKNQAAKKSYDIEYSIEGLIAEQIDNNLIYIKQSNENVIYTLSAPYMTDASGAVCEDVTITILSQENGKIVVRVNINEQWVNSRDRVFPIVVDPTIETSQNPCGIKTKEVSKNGTSTGELANRVGKYNDNIYRTYFNVTLPNIPKNSIITGANLNYGAFINTTDIYSSKFSVNIHKVTDEYDINSLTWSNQPAFEGEPSTEILNNKDKKILDNINNNNYLQTGFDISRTISEKYISGGNEIDFVLKLDSDWYTKSGNVVSSAPAINNEYFAIPASTHTNERARPILVVSYVNTIGITGHMTYHSQSLGAVNSSINDATGELTLIQNLFTDSGSRLPVSINLVYNGSNYNKFNNGGLKLAKGYTSNLNTKIVNPSSVSTTNTSKPVIMVDGDGTLLYFINKKDDDKFYNELDDKQYLEKLPTPTGGVIIKYYNETDKSELIFNNNGYLINIKDNSGNTVSLNYDSSNKLISLETADGKTINFGYVTIGGSYYLAIIKDYLNKEVILNYELAQNSVDTVLKSVVYPDSSKIEYVYGQQYNRELGTADGYIAKTVLGKSTTGSITGKLAFDFNYKSDVTHVTYYGANNAKGQEMGIIYSGNRKTEFTTSGSDDAYGTSDDLKTTYCFDNAGRTVSVYNNFDFSSSYEYSNKEDNSKNKITNTTASKKPSVNLLKNNSFENSNNWTNIASAGQSLVSTPVYSGSYSLKLLSTTTSDNEIGRKQTVTLKPSTTYTFSAYVKAENDLALATNGGAYLRVESTDSPVKSDLINCQTSPNYTFSSALDNPKESWRRLSVTFKTNSNASQPATLYVASNYMSGTVYFDAAQLEESDGATSYNLVENGGFDNDWLSWYNKDLGNGDNIINENGNKYFRFKGNLPYETKLKQTIPCNLNRDSVLMFTAKVRGNALPSKINRDLSIKIGINYSNKYSTSKTVKINTEVKDIWQTINLPVSLYHELASEIVESMTIELNYSYQANYIEFDDISLTTDPSMTYNYDSNGNLISSIKNAEQKSSMQYDADDNLKKIVDAKGYDYEYEYNNDKTLKSSQTQTGVKYEFTYDAFGNPKNVTIKPNDGNGGTNETSSTTMTSDAQYSADGKFLTKITDSRGQSVNYTYNANGSANTITDPKSVSVSNTYDGKERVSSTKTSKDTTTYGTVNYTYDSNDRLYTVNKGNATSVFLYDNYGNNYKTMVNAVDLVTNTYKNNDGKLIKTTYNNNTSYVPSYDELGRLSKETSLIGTDAIKTFNYKYNKNSQLSSVESNIGATTFTYDEIGRIAEENTERYNDKTNSRYYYDANNNIRKSTYTLNGVIREQENVYSKDNLLSQSVTNRNIMSQRYYDEFNRLSKTTIRPNYPNSVAPLFSTEYSYLAGTTGKTTNFVQSKATLDSQGNTKVTYRYVYDSVGNLKEVYDVNKDAANQILLEKYTYDDINQLTRADIASSGSYLFTYDSYGNIKQIKKGIFTTSGWSMDTEIYDLTYGVTSGIQDKVTKVVKSEYKALTGKMEITSTENYTYDNLGNPLTAGNKSFVWYGGRNLMQLTDTNLNVNYDYNNGGTRISKGVNGVRTDFYYGNGVLQAQKTGNEVIYFNYDGNGSIIGFTYQNVNYYYNKNLQGDVVSIVDSSDTTLVNYTYSAYGKVTSVTGSRANTLGKINPIRYRGYYYDEESGYYYLQSRYYNPEIGRFINADSYLSTGQGYGVLGFNMYAYCLNNPVNMVDYNGDISIFIFIEIIKSGFSTACLKITESRNLPITNLLIQNAIYPAKDIYINCGNSNNIIKTILTVKQFKEHINSIIKKFDKPGVTGFYYNSKGAKHDNGVWTDNSFNFAGKDNIDLEFALRSVDYSISGTRAWNKPDGAWSIQVTIYDVYDFDDFDLFKNAFSLADLANDIGTILQFAGVISPFDIEIVIDWSGLY